MYNELIISEVKLLADKFENDIKSKYKLMHDKNLSGLPEGGKQRGSSCKIQEQVMFELITNICLAIGLYHNDFIIKKGDLKGNGFIISNPGGMIDVGVDWHLYIKDRLVLINECKSYLDTPFLSRAHSYIDRIKKVPGNEGVKAIITSMENSTKSEALGFFMYDSVIDGCYFFLFGSREAKKPIYLAENWKQINRVEIERMITFIITVIKDNIHDDKIKSGL